MNISHALREQLRSKGASIVGYADLSEIPEQDRKGYRYGILIAVALNPEIVPKIAKGPNLEYYHEYRRVNNMLNELAEYASTILKSKGFDALPKTQSIVKIDQSTKRTELPHKTVATRAGIGWIGKCALLVTEEYGAAIRISSVLTNADLDVGAPINNARCGSCTDCQNICPASAVSGKNWEIKMDRDEFFKALHCRDKIHERGVNLGLTEATCGLCIWACPWTQRYLKKSKVL